MSNKQISSSSSDSELTDYAVALEIRQLGTTPRMLLSKMFGTRSTISTTSTDAVENMCAPVDREAAEFVKVGQGQCGKVWRLSGTENVFKIALNNEHRYRLWNDRVCHQTVEEAFRQAPKELRENIAVPSVRQWLAPSDKFWPIMQDKLPEPPAKYALVSQAIFPIPKPCRIALIDLLCPAHLQSQKEQIYQSPETKSCLLRTYLGRRDPSFRNNLKEFSLYNFPLNLSDLETIGVSPIRLAGIMADALAIMHWRASIDANDVEFVFGSSPVHKPTLSLEDLALRGPDDSDEDLTTLDFQKRHVHMWLLDFNECRKFEHNSDGLKQICRAFWFNDPYYPRPASDHFEDITLWTIFRDRYLWASEKLTSSSLPGQFITAIEKEGEERRRKAKASGAGSLFGQLMT